MCAFCLLLCCVVARSHWIYILTHSLTRANRCTTTHAHRILSLSLPLPLPLPLSFSRHTRRYVPLVVAVTKGNAPGSRTEGFFATNLCGDALVPSAARVVAAQFNLTREAGSYNVVPTTAYPHEGRCVRTTAFYFYYLLKYVRFTEMIHSHNAFTHRYFLRIFTSGRASVRPIQKLGSGK